MNELYPFQQQGADWLASKRLALLADEMGLGKTAQVIAAADTLNITKALILCPASVRVNWLREFSKFSRRGLTSAALNSSSAIGAKLSTNILTCSYDLATESENNWWLRQWLSCTTGISLLVLDEAHFLKSVEAQRSHAVLGKGGLIHAAGRTWALSGTPAPNNYAELFPLLRCFGAWRGSYDQFVDKFCQTRPTPYGRAICGHQNIPQFRAMLAPIMLRRKVEDVMPQLPKIRFDDFYVESGAVDMQICFPDYFLMRGREDIFNHKLDADRKAVMTLVQHAGLGEKPLLALEGLAKSVSTLRQYLGLQKVDGVVALVADELESGLDKIVLFAYHRNVIENLRLGLRKYGAVTLYGGTAPATRQKNIDKFAADPKCRVFIINILAAAGVDGLQKQCCEGLFVEKDWVPGNNAQAAMRLRRIGQNRPVRIRTAIIDGDELDRRTQQVLRRKMADLVLAFD